MSIITLVFDDSAEENDSELQEAIAAGDLQKVQEFIAEGVDVNHIDHIRDWGCTPLEHATELGYLDIVRVLLAAGAARNHGVNATPLCIAAKMGRVDIVCALIDAGVNINEGFEGHTALMSASCAGHTEVVKLLVKMGANVNLIREDDGASALLCAANNGWQEVFDYLALLTSKELLMQAVKELPAGLVYRHRKDDLLTEEFILAAGEGITDDVKQAIAAGADINAIDSHGNTALCFAAYWGQSSVIRVLVEAGANLEKQDEQNGWTPLIAAVMMGQFDVVQTLLKSGADIDNIDRDGQTALMLATRLNFSAKYHGPRLFPQNFFRHVEVFKCLLEFGADVNAKIDSGWTALMAATNFRNIKAVELLLQTGADVNAKDIRGDTALSHAKKANNQEIVQLLLENGAKED